MKNPRQKSSYTMDELVEYGKSLKDRKEAQTFLDSLDTMELVLVKECLSNKE